MVTDDEISKAMIERIDKKIKALTQAKQAILDAFSNKNETTSPMLFNDANVSSGVIVTRKNPTRKDTVAALIQREGGLSRKDIIEKSGLPKGTIAFVLNDKNIFMSKDDKWYLKEDKVIN